MQTLINSSKRIVKRSKKYHSVISSDIPFISLENEKYMKVREIKESQVKGEGIKKNMKYKKWVRKCKWKEKQWKG
jgi:hypothetical protein